MKKLICIFIAISAFVAARAVTFEELRLIGKEGKAVALPKGTELIGISISDYRSENLELNPNLKWDKIDIGENYRTAYVESEDGKFGFRLKFDGIYDCRMQIGQKVRLDLSGCILEKQIDPERYTIRGLGKNNVSVIEEGVAIPRKVRSSSELRDEDIYTQVILTGLELSSKTGSYCNIHEKCTLPSDKNVYSRGAANIPIPAMDGWATLFLSSDGCPIYMLINSRCSWRRDDYRVKTGVGPIRGILVHTELPRYGGNIGRYAIRPLFKKDLILSPNPISSYTTLAEWNWDHNYYDALKFRNRGEVRCIKRKQFLPADSIVADDGIGELLSQSGDMVGLAEEFNSRVSIDGIGGMPRGGRDKAALSLSSSTGAWYGENDAKGIVAVTAPGGIQGRSVIVTYSFAVTAPDEARAYNFPEDWAIQYSSDGKSWINSTSAPAHLTPLFYRDGEISSDAAMGYTEHFAILPMECLNYRNLYVRLVPVSKRPVGESAFLLNIGSFSIRVLK